MNIQYQEEEENFVIGEPVFPKQSSDPKPHMEEETPQQIRKEIIHEVAYGDTLEGLSLTYGVPISQIKTRNKIECDDIYYFKKVIIPNSMCQPVFTKQQVDQEQMKIECFISYMHSSEKSAKTARYYLSENEWNVTLAYQQYKRDLDWEKKNLSLKSKPISSLTGKMKPRDEFELTKGNF